MKRLLKFILLVFCSLNIIYAAECDTSTYNIVYYVNGGERIESISTNDLSTIESLKLPTAVKGKDEFLGWYFLDGKQVETKDIVEKFKKSKTCETTVNIYAKYKSVCEKSDVFLTVSFDTDGGSNIADLEITADPIKEMIPTKEGYNFVGWYYGDKKVNWNKRDLINLVETKISPNGCIAPKYITLKAKWVSKDENITVECNNEIVYSIDFVTNAPIGIRPYYSTEDYYDSLPVLSIDNYNFLGWYLDKDFKTKVSDTIINSINLVAEKTKDKDGCEQAIPITLYAKWEKIDKCMSGGYAMYVRYQTNGGSPEKEDFIVVNSNIIKKLPIPTREGYVFAGWYYDKTLTDRVYTNILPKLRKDRKTDANGCAMYSDITLYAKWLNSSVYDSLSYYLNFQVNGADPITTMEVHVNSDSAALLPVPVRDGYVFAGWYYDGRFDRMVTTNRIVEIAKDFILDENDNPVYANNMTLYARWIPIEKVENESKDEDAINYFADGNYVIQITNEKDSSIINIIVENILENAEIENIFKRTFSFLVMYNTYIYGTGEESVPIKANIAFAVPKNLDYEKLAVYGLQNGKKINYKYTIKDDMIIVNTDKLGIFVIGETIDRTFDIVVAALCSLLVLVLIIYAKKCNFKIMAPVKEKLLEDSNKNIVPKEKNEEVKEEKNVTEEESTTPVTEENDSSIESNIDKYLTDRENKKEEPKPVVVEENDMADLASDIVEISDDGESAEEVVTVKQTTKTEIEIDIPDFDEVTNDDK